MQQLPEMANTIMLKRGEKIGADKFDRRHLLQVRGKARKIRIGVIFLTSHSAR